MAPLPRHRPHQLSLGPLEREILEIIWAQGGATVREIHDQILADPNRDLSQASVTTVLQRLVKKGWLQRQSKGKGEEGGVITSHFTQIKSAIDGSSKVSYALSHRGRRHDLVSQASWAFALYHEPLQRIEQVIT
ncbi:MAG: BlaI/MecI/CopY family transcriptional regulator [Nodosilinea sp. LVE1205-7]|jgi:predicted transcriptional regulator